MNERVPSIGSSTQVYSASGLSLPNSSPMIPWAGKWRRISCRMAASPALSASVTGSKAPLFALFSKPIVVRKKGRMAFPDTVASSFTKAARSTGRMACS
jgi:hypothetical protein